jgi:CspA family cold shock protein
MRGKVVSFDNGKGYGFIAKDDGSGDVFCHHTAINMSGFRTLVKGDNVTFDVEISERTKKPQAANVRPDRRQ